jgi:hypothetical protein
MEVRGITLERSLKWVGGVTAVLSLIFGLRQITQIVSDVRERQRQVAELSKIGKLQQGAADYESAWGSFEQALKTAESGGQLAKLTGQLSAERRELRKAQEDLAMEWAENARPSRGQTFSDVVDKVVPVLNRGITSASGARKADLLAHFGWANFLRSRDGRQDLNPEQQYREALEIDPTNPYAHAHWGHWNLWRSEKKMEEARGHFSAAIAAGRARGYVRKIQFAAWKNLRGEGDGGSSSRWSTKCERTTRRSSRRPGAISIRFILLPVATATMPRSLRSLRLRSRRRSSSRLFAPCFTAKISTSRAVRAAMPVWPPFWRPPVKKMKRCRHG